MQTVLLTRPVSAVAVQVALFSVVLVGCSAPPTAPPTPATGPSASNTSAPPAVAPDASGVADAANGGETTTATPMATGTGQATGTAVGTMTSMQSPDASPSSADASADAEAGSPRQDASTPGTDAAVVTPPGCILPSPVSFTKDIQPFLATSCGNTSAGGCHVVDADSTMAQGGYDHAYDWITGTAHASSCPETPTPFRFQVVLAVMQEADPASCSKCRLMPITSAEDPRTAPSTCQLASLQAWLDEPFVTQPHRPDGISPTTPYAMPPFN